MLANQPANLSNLSLICTPRLWFQAKAKQYDCNPMTPEQTEALAGAALNDLILITGGIEPSIGPENIRRLGYQLLLIDMIVTGLGSGARTILVRPVHSFTPRDWIRHRRFGVNYWFEENRHMPIFALDSIIDESSHIDLRPCDDTILQRLLHYVCPWEFCNEGLVPVNDSTSVILRNFQQPTRRTQFERGQTICPICTGTQFYCSHEDQVTKYYGFPVGFDREGYATHIHRINRRRTRLMYAAVAWTGEPAHLTISTFQPDPWAAMDEDSRPQPAVIENQTARAQISREVIRFLNRRAPAELRTAQSTTSSSPSTPTIHPATHTGPVTPISTKPYAFYQKAVERVINNECGICYEPYADGAKTIVELPCWHFFHQACFQRWRSRECPYRCNEKPRSR